MKPKRTDRSQPWHLSLFLKTKKQSFKYRLGLQSRPEVSMNSLPDSVLGGESKDLNEKAAELAGDTLETPEPELPAVLLKRHIILTSFFKSLSSFKEH